MFLLFSTFKNIRKHGQFVSESVKSECEKELKKLHHKNIFKDFASKKRLKIDIANIMIISIISL